MLLYYIQIYNEYFALQKNLLTVKQLITVGFAL